MNTTILYSLGNTLKIPISDSDGRSGSATLEINSDPHEAAVISQTVSVLNGEGVFELSEDEKKKLKIGNYVYRIIFTDTDSITTEWSGIFAVIYGAANEKNGVLIPSKLNIEVVNSPNSAVSSGIYAIEDETVVFNTKYRQILIVSEYIEPAMGEETILQALFDAEHGAIKLRKRVDYIWSDWEAVGEADLSEYIKITDYATKSDFGIVKIGDGIQSVDGVIQTDIANESLIAGRNSAVSVNEVITPSNLNFAVKSALSDDNRISDMTDEEKANARGVIGALGESAIDNYYTKSQVDTKLSSVYKYKGTVQVALLLPTETKNAGDVYNVYCGITSTPEHIIKSQTLYSITGNGDTCIVNITGLSSTLAPVGAYIAITVEMPNSFGGSTLSAVAKVKSLSANNLTVELIRNDNDPVIKDLVDAGCFGSNWGIIQAALAQTSPLTVRQITTSTSTVRSIDGMNYAWTGTTWDNLGGYIDISAKADKSSTLIGYGITDAYTKTEVDGKIAAAIETALNTEV